MNEFLQRLRERKLVQWALAYVAAAFALIQVLDIVAQRFGWPEQTVRFVIIALAVGFFVTLVLAWYHGERGAQRVTGTELLILALLLSIGGAVVWRLAPTATGQAAGTSNTTAAMSTSFTNAPPDHKSIAVLPFENLSDEKANGYFAVGIQDEILTRLAKIGALKVISRTSTQHYASSPDNLPEIAKELGVANILEGSVQKAGDAVHINVQLIRAATDDHLWAEVYNRKLDDVFGVEGEVAGAIADALNAKLTGEEKAAIAKIPTDNPAAYDAYLRGLALAAAGYDFTTTRKGAAALEEAVRLDPKFALAWADLAGRAGYLYFNNIDPAKYTAQYVKNAADTAFQLQPQLSEAQLAQGDYLYRIKRDFAGAEKAYEAVLQYAPNNKRALQSLGLVERRQGKWESALAHLEQAATLDPRNAGLLTTIGGETLQYMRRFSEGRDWLDRALAIAPGDALEIAHKASSYQAEGRLEDAARMLDAVPQAGIDPEVAFRRGYQRLLERRYPTAIAELEPLQAQPDSALNGFGPALTLYLGIAQRSAGQAAQAQSTFEHLITRIEPMAGQVDDSQVPVSLALAYAYAGRQQAALEQARRAIELYRTDAILRPYAESALAQIQAIGGDHAAAITACDSLLKVFGDSVLTPALLRLDPIWDPLRKDPRFQKLIDADKAAAVATAKP